MYPHLASSDRTAATERRSCGSEKPAASAGRCGLNGPVPRYVRGCYVSHLKSLIRIWQLHPYRSSSEAMLASYGLLIQKCFRTPKSRFGQFSY